ncbi:MAG: reductive dehalogenase [Proteobacteria bacterium]|nr:reductive dehalogenase [Pseudomonadota bacterium]
MGNKTFFGVCLLATCLIVSIFYGVTLADDETFRALLKAGGLLGALLGLVGVSLAGYLAGRSYDSYTGWERYTHGAGMFFNRNPFRRDRPTYGVDGPTRRVKWEESFIGRMGMVRSLLMPSDGSESKWNPGMGVEALPEPLKSYFQEDPESYDWTFKNMEAVMHQMADWEKYKIQFAVVDAWSASMASLFEEPMGTPHRDRQYPPEPKGPPEEWDFRGIRREEPLPFKSPEHAAELIKKITHTFGATLVGITKLNPDWCFQGYLRGVGPGDYEVPNHWEYAIVFATPHEWDSMYANPVYGSSYDAYSRERIIGARLEAFLHELGYPARAHVPPNSYDMMMPPLAVDAGLGEQSRKGLVVTPELGSNARLACVTTNVPMAVDKPIEIGVQEFCRKCMICAEQCPSGAISRQEGPDIEFGYRRWRIKDNLCFNIWARVAQSHPRGCRICLAVCPYTRKNNWIHALSRYVDPRDPTGIVSSTLLWMQKKLFYYPKARDFLPPPRGKNATYHQPPDWLQTEKWFDVDKTW